MPPRKKKNLEEVSPQDEPATSNNHVEDKANSKGYNWKWNKNSTLIYGDSGCQPNKKILGFDMDDTLIKTKSGAKFPKDAKDWVFWDSKVPSKLKEWHEKGYKIVIFTNQNGITKGHTTEKDIKTKIENISQQIGVPLQALIASADDSYRKPSITLWKYFAENMNGTEQIDIKESIYCGDAAGRVGKKKDFSDTDLKFALNIGLKFQTPEEFFLGEKQKVPTPEFNPKNIPKTGSIFKDSTSNDVKNSKGAKEMIIFVGSPASGKSTFWKTYLSDYVRVNRDTLKTREKCLKVAEEALENGKNVVLDNTSPTKQDRKAFIDLAKRYDYDVRAFFFEIEKALAFHLDTLRETNSHRKHLSGRVGSIPIHSFFKNCEKPEKSEGFSEVKCVRFVAGPFENKDDEETFFSFSTGKK